MFSNLAKCLTIATRHDRTVKPQILNLRSKFSHLSDNSLPYSQFLHSLVFISRAFSLNSSATMTFQTSKESSRPFTVMVEGNIGSGKTTLLKHFAKINGVETYQEPVDRWRDVKGHNTLALMYDDPKRWSLTFQTFVQLTMVDIHT